MAVILATAVSILAIAGVAWAARKVLNVPLCPICFGVGGTWLWMIVGRSMGYAVDATMLPILLGGSVVGIAYQVEKRLPQGRSPMLWKMLFVPVGFAAAYALGAAQWALSAAMGLALVLLSAFFLRSPSAPEAESEAVERLKRKLRSCC
jgi:hypothetical protein